VIVLLAAAFGIKPSKNQRDEFESVDQAEYQKRLSENFKIP
jgi:hypothetical protein